VRQEVKPRNVSDISTLYRVDEGRKRNVVINIDFGIGTNIRLKSRVQYNSYRFNAKTMEGFVMAQDVMLSLGRFQFSGRHALFHTDHYDNRTYVYEHDAWLSYSLPSYSGVGVRNYALVEYKVHKHLTLWARYARTQLLEDASMGSGLEAIEGNTKNDVKFQARITF
jgi:hypothetical protein